MVDSTENVSWKRIAEMEKNDRRVHDLSEGKYHLINLLILLVLGLTSPITSLAQKANIADFRYSPPEWQTAICLPDDPFKSLVDKSGALLYHYRQGGREFGTRIEVKVTDGAVWRKQELLSPKVPVVITYLTKDKLDIREEAFAVDKPVRSDWVLIRISNSGNTSCTVTPKLIVDTKMGLKLIGQKVIINTRESITSSLKMVDYEKDTLITLAAVSIAAGATAEFSVCYSPGGINPEITATIDQSVRYWQDAGLPSDRIEIPDAGIQALINSSIRNIWQAREIKNGLSAFQVGPTCYRGLWIVDGAFLLEAATILGAGNEARNGITYELSMQKRDGRIEVMKDKYGYWKENGIVLWTCVRHALLTQDKKWLESVWPKLQRIAQFIKLLRTDQTADASLEAGLIPRAKHTLSDQGLMPQGIIDGGIQNGVEYTNTYWNLAGLRSFIEAANWLGKPDEATIWQKEYDDFRTTMRKAASRDIKVDQHGNSYLPILMNGEDLPQRGQWAFCQAVYPGRIFDRNDPMVTDNIAMLQSTEKEGMVIGTGWDAKGIWTYFASFYGHACLWLGNGNKAAQILYAFANHAAPTLVWREEQALKGEKFRKVGDMPHNWASAEFIRLATHLIELDRGNELHLLEGFPHEWNAPGMVTRLNGIATPFGQLYMSVIVSKDGTSATLKLSKLTSNRPNKIILHLAGLTGEMKTIELPNDTDVNITIQVKQDRK